MDSLGDYIFNPESVAIAGVSTRQTELPSQGQRYLRILLDYGFKGRIYPLNPKGGEMLGLKIYPNVRDVPDTVDYVISCVPSSAAPQLIRDCAAKGVKAVHLFTSGFSEAGTDEGRRLEAEICGIAREGGVRLIGPNCAGLYCPKAGLATRTDFAKESGPVGLICQSGGNTTYLVREGASRGIRFSKAVSYGNAADVNETELLEYLADDEETQTILVYIEGVRDGDAFSRVLRKAAAAKPVVVLKSGVTESGAGAAASHTGALAGSDEVWDNLLRQAGAVRVRNMEELIDSAVAFSCLPPLLGRRAAVLGVGGGATVLATDECIRSGLEVPRFTEATCRKLRSLVREEAGTILDNPIDLSLEAFGVGFHTVVRTLADYEGTDLTIVHFPLGLSPYQAFGYEKMWNPLLQDVLRGRVESAKPLVLVVHIPTFEDDYAWRLWAQRECRDAGIPVYHSIAGAARAVDRLVGYFERRGADS